MKVNCACGATLVVDSRRAGSAVRCPRCRQQVAIGGPSVEGSAQTSDLDAVVPHAEPAPVAGAEPAPAQLGDSTAPESLAPPLPNELPGMEPSDEGRRSALHLAIAIGVVGVFSTLPGILYLFEHSTPASLAALAMPRWVAVLLLTGGLHLAYALYLAQLPDWSTAWVVAITMLVVATLDSVLLAATLLGSANSGVIRLLELHDYLRGGKAAGWCFIMLSLNVTVAYCAGRVATRWRAAETARLQALHLID
ncbi:MAG: hypothetical protein KDB14_24810 [Planctomycetales bacterium]|nr:hypothetical protein [Planctomycetales bacterium]